MPMLHYIKEKRFVEPGTCPVGGWTPDCKEVVCIERNPSILAHWRAVFATYVGSGNKRLEADAKDYGPTEKRTELITIRY